MGAAVPIIGQIITSFVVGKVASKVASAIGLSDDMAGLVGIGAGLWAGSAMFSSPTHTSSTMPAAPGPAGATTQAPIDASATGGMMARNTPPAVMTPETGMAGLQPSGAVTTPVSSEVYQAGNVAPTTVPPVQPQTVAPVTQQVAGEIPQTVTPTVTPVETESWWDKIWNSDRTMDTLVGAAGGMAQGYMTGQAVEDRNKAIEDRQDEMSDRWKNHNYSGPRIQYPTRQSGMMTRGSS